MASATVPVPRASVDMVVRGPLPVLLEDPTGEASAASPGCYILDLNFPQPIQVAEIFFHNFYTAWLSVMIRSQPIGSADSGPCPPPPAIGSTAARETPWQMAIPRRNLMPNPHLETGSHDFVSILATESESSIQSMRKNTQNALRVALPTTQQQQQQQQQQPQQNQQQPQQPPTPLSLASSGSQSNHPKSRARETAALYEIANLLPT